MVFGTFDILHFGHINLFKQAKKMGDKLIVVLARDSNVLKIKGDKPFHDEKERLEIIKNLSLVDIATLGSETNVYQVIKDLKPNIIALGYDQNIFVDKLKKYLKENDLNMEIKRLLPYKENRLKSHFIKTYGQQDIDSNHK